MYNNMGLYKEIGRRWGYTRRGRGYTRKIFEWIFTHKRLSLDYTKAKTEDFQKNVILHLQPKIRVKH